MQALPAGSGIKQGIKQAHECAEKATLAECDSPCSWGPDPDYADNQCSYSDESSSYSSKMMNAMLPQGDECGWYGEFWKASIPRDASSTFEQRLCGAHFNETAMESTCDTEAAFTTETVECAKGMCPAMGGFYDALYQGHLFCSRKTEADCKSNPKCSWGWFSKKCESNQDPEYWGRASLSDDCILKRILSSTEICQNIEAKSACVAHADCAWSHHRCELSPWVMPLLNVDMMLLNECDADTLFLHNTLTAQARCSEPKNQTACEAVPAPAAVCGPKTVDEDAMVSGVCGTTFNGVITTIILLLVGLLY